MSLLPEENLVSISLKYEDFVFTYARRPAPYGGIGCHARLGE